MRLFAVRVRVRVRVAVFLLCWGGAADCVIKRA